MRADWLEGGLAVAPPSTWLLALLIGGHLLGDFLFQSRAMARGKREARVLGGHVLAVMLVHIGALLPFLSVPVLAAVAVIGVSHALIDAVKSRSRPGLVTFLLDQAAHVLVLLGVWRLLLRWGPGSGDAFDGWVSAFVVATVVAAALAFVARGGSAIVSATLASLDPALEPEETPPGMKGSGRLIGILERLTAVILIVLGQWGAIGLLMAAKSIARFEELKERRFAEYYLVGTLTSLLVAIVVGLVLIGILTP